MPNRFDHRGKQKLNQNPNSSSSSSIIASSSSSGSSRFTNTKPGTSKQVQKNKSRNPPNQKKKKKKETQIWVKKGTRRNWLELPRDVMLHVFLKLNVIDLLCNAQSVCSSWREIARDPLLYRRIDISNPWNYLSNPWSYFYQCDSSPVVNMAVKAIDRSLGQLVDFSIVYFGTDEMLQRIVETSCRLKCLRLANCGWVSDHALVEVFKKMPSLEVVEMSLCPFITQTVEALGRACPALKSFRLNGRGLSIPPGGVGDDLNLEALAIAGNMPGLRSLNLFGNSMTNNGLQAILDKCPHLEYLDLRQCFNVDLKEDLWKKCQGIKTVRLPKDSIEDYEFDSTVDPLGLYDDGSYDDGAYLSDYDDFTDPFNPIYWSDDEDYKFIHGIDEDDCLDLGELLLLKALLRDDEYDHHPGFGF